MRIKLPSFILLILAGLSIGLGVMRREHLEVLRKAIRICLECIGVG